MASISRRSKGWQVQIRKQGYQSISKRFDKKADADAWARMTESEMDRGVFIDRTEAEKTTLAEILNRYLNEVSIHKLGYKQERSRIKSFLAHPLALRYLATLKSLDFTIYRESRLLLVSGTTVNKELNLLGRIIDTARKDWSIHMENPIRFIRRPKSNRPRDRRLHSDELNLILKTTKSEVLSKIILFALETALRRGELANAKWSDLNHTECVLKVPETKTGEPRIIPLSRKAMEVLEALKKGQSDSIFSIRADSITQAFDRACERSGVENLHFHDLRHEATSRLFEKGLNPMQVSSITGHKTFEMLKRYTHLKAKDLVRLLN